jgi:hypothetical protein
MKVNVKKFQAGGPMSEEQGAPMPAEAGATPAPAEVGNEQEAMMEQIYQMAAEVIQQMGPEAAAMLAQAIMEQLQGGAPAQEAPVFKFGGSIAKRGGRR